MNANSSLIVMQPRILNATTTSAAAQLQHPASRAGRASLVLSLLIRLGGSYYKIKVRLVLFI